MKPTTIENTKKEKTKLKLIQTHTETKYVLSILSMDIEVEGHKTRTLFFILLNLEIMQITLDKNKNVINFGNV